MRPGRWTPLLAAAVVVLAAVGCAGDDTTPEAASPSALEMQDTPATAATTAPTETATSPTEVAPAPVAATATEANAAALDFRARRLSGGTLDGVQLAGGDVVLWMWAPWCPQCNREAPHVADALATHGDDITFVGIAGHDSDDAHRAFVAEHGLEDMLHLVDDDGSLWAQYGVSYQPAWVFIDDDGDVQQVAGGLYEDLDDRLQALVDR